MSDAIEWPEWLTPEHSAIHTAVENEIVKALYHCYESADAAGMDWTTEGWISCSASNVMGMLERLGCPPPPVGLVDPLPMPQPEFGDEPLDTCEKCQGEFGVSELRFSQRCEACSVLAADHEAEVERLRAIEVAFAELPTSTQALAHAAATVRARLGEGWELNSYNTVFGSTNTLNPRPCVDVRRADRAQYISFHRDLEGSWRWNASLKEGVCPTLDDAITAALAAVRIVLLPR